MSSFGVEFEQIWPKVGATIKFTDFGKSLLKKCETIQKPDASKVDIKEFIRKSSNFPVEFGTNTCRVISQPKDRYPIIEQQIASAYPVIHERVLGLYLAFLEHKCQYGSNIEKTLYKNVSLTELVTRLLNKRCVSFLGPSDAYSLLTGEHGGGGFEEIGTESERSPLVLQNLISYDEMKLSAFLSVSSHTDFLNDGNRFNSGVIEEDKSKIVPAGVVVGLIGGRFERRNCMEWQDVLITKQQNTKANGYGLSAMEHPSNRSEDYRRLWTHFYEDQDFLYETAKTLDIPRIDKSLPHEEFFDKLLMSKRYAISFDTLLLEAEARAAALGTQAYIHVVGIGLGVWKVLESQNQIFLLTFAQRLKVLAPKLAHIGVAHFSWFHTSECGELKDGGLIAADTHPKGGICIFLHNRNPADKLPQDYKDMLAVVSYAWDSNALPGNEFWVGSLSGSNDPSTACSTLISELHNGHINTEMVNGENLHVATLENGLMHISDYSKKYM